MHDLKRSALAFLFLSSIALWSTPAFAQMDLAGEWAPQFHEDQPERLAGPDIGDYAGLPINDAARMAADAWNADILSVPEHQCKPHPSDYSPRGPAQLQIWKEVDPVSRQVIAWRTHIMWQAPERWIYMDGRPHPDEFAAHTWQGFSTGEWVGQVLKVTTTHLKKGWIRRNGVPRSDQAELTEYFWRHGEYLTWTVIINDPIYLTEPMVRSSDFRWAPGQNVGNYPCQIVTELDHEQGWLPHWLPGTNPYLDLYSKTYDVIPGSGARRRRDHASGVSQEGRRGSEMAATRATAEQSRRQGRRRSGGGRCSRRPGPRWGSWRRRPSGWTARRATSAWRTRSVKAMNTMKPLLALILVAGLFRAGLAFTTPVQRGRGGHNRHRHSAPRSSIRSRRSITPMPTTEQSAPFPFATTSG